MEPPHEINYPKNDNEKYLKHQKTARLAQLPTEPDAVKSKKKNDILNKCINNLLKVIDGICNITWEKHHATTYKMQTAA